MVFKVLKQVSRSYIWWKYSKFLSAYTGLGLQLINTTFINTTFILLLFVLLVEETRVPDENHRPTLSHKQIVSHTIV